MTWEFGPVMTFKGAPQQSHITTYDIVDAKILKRWQRATAAVPAVKKPTMLRRT